MSSFHFLTPLVRLLSYRYLLIPPILLTALHFLALFVHSDVDVALLWSQCHSRERIPLLSRFPALGTPLCFLVSFLQVALESWRSRATMAVVLSFLGALATVCWLESRRVCNKSYTIIARPTGPWLALNLLGGMVVWQVVIVPVFIHRARTIFLDSEKRISEDEDGDGEAAEPSESDATAALAGETGRMIPDSDAVAIPVAMALGFFLPSILILFISSPVVVFIWLFFPIYVTLIQKAVRYGVAKFQRAGPTDVLLERHWQAILLVYALPVLFSVMSHVFFLWSMTQADDRRKLTKLAASLIEIDTQFIGFGLLYWLFVEAGWRLPLFVISASVVVGPGAGTCLGWLYRERLIRAGEAFELVGEEPEEGDGVDEDTPLLR